MNTRTASTLISLVFFGLLAGCGGGGGGGAAPPAPPPPPPPPPPPVAPMSAAGIWVGEALTPDVADIVTSFEFNDSNGFVLGDAPFTADFQGGVTESRSMGALYSAGVFSWHVNTAGGSIDFAIPGDSLVFSTRLVSAVDVATIRVLDEFGIEISSTAVTNVFQSIDVQRNPGDALIGSVDITVTTGEIVIDSFTFGFPSTASNDIINCLFAPAPRDDFVCSLADLGGDLLASANGTYSVNGDQVSGAGNLYAPPGETLVDGSSIAPLTISTGTVDESTTFDLTITSSGLAIDVTTTFDALYDRGADLATVAAVYTTFDIFGDMSSFTIDAGGVISGQSATGCVLNGQASVIDAAVNAYDVNLVVTNVGTCNVLVGDYDGLAASTDLAGMDDQFVLAVFVDGQLFIVGNAVK